MKKSQVVKRVNQNRKAYSTMLCMRKIIPKLIHSKWTGPNYKLTRSHNYPICVARREEKENPTQSLILVINTIWERIVEVT